jgi:hypothetical protein
MRYNAGCIRRTALLSLPFTFSRNGVRAPNRAEMRANNAHLGTWWDRTLTTAGAVILLLVVAVNLLRLL